MLLAVDAGNTQTVFGLYDGPELGERWRIATEAERTGDELGALLGDFLDFGTLEGICLSCTVPRLIREYEHLAERWAKTPLLVVGPGVKTGIQIQYDDPREVGPDRVMNAVAGQVDGIVDAIRKELGSDAPAIATGGLADLIAPHSRTISKIDPFLTLDGLRIVWARNREPA